MPDAMKALPHATYASPLVVGGGAAYCSHPIKGQCLGGVILWVLGACVLGLDPGGVCLDPNAVGPLGAITLGGPPDRTAESGMAVTLRGLQLEDPLSAIFRLYKTAHLSTGTCGSIIPMFSGPAYVVVSGMNTMSIATLHGRVRAITLISGRHPNLCEPFR